ncbi:unnamed protein product [Ascophyllum nodosum]
MTCPKLFASLVFLLAATLFIFAIQSQEQLQSSLEGQGRRARSEQHERAEPALRISPTTTAGSAGAVRHGGDVSGPPTTRIRGEDERNTWTSNTTYPFERGLRHRVRKVEGYHGARRLLPEMDPPGGGSLNTTGGAGRGDRPHLSIKNETKVGEHGDAEANDARVDRALVPSYCPAQAFERYTALHRKIVNGEAPPRYLVYRPYLYCGMGNRLRGFEGVLLLAMVTERALMVDWYGGVPDRDKWAHKYEDNFLQAYGVAYSDFPSDLDDYENAPGTEIWCQMPNAIHLSTPCDESRMTPHFLSVGNWASVYAAETKVVIVQAHNGDPVSFLRENQDADVVKALSTLDAEIGGADTFGRCALRFLFEAKPEFRRRYCEERQSVLGGKFASVSMHIRTGDNPNYHPEWYLTLPQNVQNFVACTAGLEKGLAFVSANSSSDDLDFGGFDGREGTTGSVWLLGTDSESVIGLMNKGNYTVDYGGKVAYVEGDKFHRTHSGSKAGVKADNAGPLIDLILLSESLLLVESYHSTFSRYIAQVGGLPAAVRMILTTPFARIFGSRPVEKGTLPWLWFDDFEEGCRKFVTDPKRRDSLELALRASREPFIVCEEGDDRHDRE